MKKAHVQEESGGEKAPLWIISFADMISLLMAFFVMLQTMATEHTEELFTTGRGKFEATMGEFRRNIDNFGMPGLFGKAEDNLQFSTTKKKYNFDSPEPQPVTNPAADGNREKLQRIFARLSQPAKTKRPQLTGKTPNSMLIPVQFTADGQLDAAGTACLKQYIAALGEIGTSRDAVVYVVGAAPDVPSPSEQWIVSEQRACNVAQILRAALPGTLRENVYWWGAGSGGYWFASANNIKNQNHVLIVTLTTSNP